MSVLALVFSLMFPMGGLYAQSANGQGSASREVVQPLPSPEVQRLNRALLELARRPNRIGNLIEAADASLAVGDLDAAVGFYGRAAEDEPDNAQVKLGLAKVFVQSGRPLEAIPLLNAAISAGAAPRDVLSDQALAFDLVGDQAAAQQAYARAIEISPQDDEARRRLAISKAISGDEAGFQETLSPLLLVRDMAAFRARAFGLAILGKQDRAAAIVNQVMPRDLATRINPYLAYMPRLTPSQQAAAANLGIFPQVADIGRDDPRIARFAAEGVMGSRLEPSGAPLGTSPDPQIATVSREVVQSEPPAKAQTAEELASVADAFADLGEGELPMAAGADDAVDITAIEVRREAPVEATPPTPAHPRRIWVQVATGRDVDALRFDWRRLQRRAPELLGDLQGHVTPWGQANRLLAGPVSSRSQARELINSLGSKGIETFSYISPEGTEIQPLN